jgi:hypothetical protein
MPAYDRSSSQYRAHCPTFGWGTRAALLDTACLCRSLLTRISSCVLSDLTYIYVQTSNWMVADMLPDNYAWFTHTYNTTSGPLNPVLYSIPLLENGQTIDVRTWLPNSTHTLTISEAAFPNLAEAEMFPRVALALPDPVASIDLLNPGALSKYGMRLANPSTQVSYIYVSSGFNVFDNNVVSLACTGSPTTAFPTTTPSSTPSTGAIPSIKYLANFVFDSCK